MPTDALIHFLQSKQMNKQAHAITATETLEKLARHCLRLVIPPAKRGEQK